MKIYAFILGRKYLLSVAELCQVFSQHNIHIIDITPEALIVTLPELSNPQATLNKLGGSIKIIEITEEIAKDINILPKTIAKMCLDEAKNSQKKFSYGVSVYSFKDQANKVLKKSLNLSKELLKENNLKSRYINKDFTNPPNAALKGQKVLTEGAEIIAIKGKHKIFLGKTLAIQDFEEYSHRDYERPERDPRLGMLPPKLSQIMINLNGLHKIDDPENLSNFTIYDPFCGVGTVLSEAYLMGYNVIGSDINPEVVTKARKNLDWTRNNNFSPTQEIKLFSQNAEMINPQDLTEHVDAIVSETYLGPPMSHFPTHKQMDSTFSSIEATILNFFRTIKNLLEPGTPIIISLLAYRDRNRYITMDHLIEKIQMLGFQTEELIPGSIQAKFDLPNFEDQSLIYDRPDQIVCRAIWKFIS